MDGFECEQMDFVIDAGFDTGTWMCTSAGQDRADLSLEEVQVMWFNVCRRILQMFRCQLVVASANLLCSHLFKAGHNVTNISSWREFDWKIQLYLWSMLKELWGLIFSICQMNSNRFWVPALYVLSVPPDDR